MVLSNQWPGWTKTDGYAEISHGGIMLRCKIVGVIRKTSVNMQNEDKQKRSYRFCFQVLSFIFLKLLKRFEDWKTLEILIWHESWYSTINSANSLVVLMPFGHWENWLSDSSLWYVSESKKCRQHKSVCLCPKFSWGTTAPSPNFSAC